MAKSRINFIVTDLDDTIWDWLRMWHGSFEPYVRRIGEEFNIELHTLKSGFKKIHQKYGSSEFSFIYNELDCLSENQKNMFSKEEGSRKSIIHEYNSNKKNSLFLFGGVLDSLLKIKSSGALIVGFTESNAFFTKYRLKHLNLDGVIDYIYAPLDIGVPDSVYKIYPEEFWQPEITEMRYLPRDMVKPAPEILEIIIQDFNAKKSNTIYIGDKLDKDISMANSVSVSSVYAKYGHQIETEQYQLLRDVTHWKEEHVQREKECKEKNRQHPIADYTLENSFNEIFRCFDFFPFDLPVNRKIAPEVVKIWEKVIDVQQHFNDIALRIRSLAVTFFTFIIAGIGYCEKEGLSRQIGSADIPYSTILAAFGIIIISAFFYMDRAWYHRLLLGAVKQGGQIEQRWFKVLPELKLSMAIGESSPHRFFRWKVHSKGKFWFFYGFLWFVLIIIGVVLFLVRNCPPNNFNLSYHLL